MLKGKLTFLLLLFVSLSFGQSKMLLASMQQASASGDPWKSRFGSELLLYLNPATIDTDAVTDGTALSDTGAPIWADGSDNAFAVTLGGGTFALNVGTTGRQLEWTASAWLDVVDAAALEHNTNIPYAIVYRIGDGANVGGSGYTISKAPSSTGREGTWFGSSATYGGVYAGGTTTALSPATAPANHVAIVQFNASTVDVWVDGTQVLSGGTRGTVDNDGQSWNIGGRTDGSYLAASGFTMDYAIIIGNNSTGYTLTAADRTWIWGQLQVN